MKICLFNVKYSPNLGDGLLSECLEREILRVLPGASVRSIDLAGRKDYPVPSSSKRRQMMAVLEALPSRLRLLLTGTILRMLIGARLKRHYRRGLEGGSIALIGGGNLFTDHDLNFPLKIAAACDEVRTAGLPTLVYGVGVAEKWSASGRGYFKAALTSVDLRVVAVRDEHSRRSWDEQLGNAGLRNASVVIDPGMLACRHYPVPPQSVFPKPVGFCITNPLAVRYHSDSSRPEVDLDQWYPQAIKALVDKGLPVALFTNGSPEDRDYLHANATSWLLEAKGPVTITSSFTQPIELVQFIAGCRAIIGHRMHAHIAAYSFGVPALGLSWDVKLQSFFDLAGRSEHFVDPALCAPSELSARLERSIDDGFDPTPLVERASREVEAIAAQIRGMAQSSAAVAA